MFAPATVLMRKIENDISGSLARSSQTTNPTSRATAAATKMPIVLAERPAVVVRLGDAEHGRRETGGDEHGTGRVEARRRHVTALAEEQRREGDRGDADRDVEEEDPLPAQRVREDATEEHACGGTEATDGAPDAEGDVALLPLDEGRHQDRERGRRDDRRTQPLQGAGADQRRLVPREPGEQRGHAEEREAEDEHAPAADEVGRAPAEEQEAPEEERVGADHPLEVLLGEPEIHLDRREGDVHDRDVEDDHELDDAQERQRPPLVILRSNHETSPFESGAADRAG